MCELSTLPQLGLPLGNRSGTWISLRSCLDFSRVLFLLERSGSMLKTGATYAL